MFVSDYNKSDVILQLRGVVDKFKYLCEWINNTDNPRGKIKITIEQTRFAFIKMRNIFTSSYLTLPTRLVVLLYDCEIGMLKVSSVNRLEEAFKM